MPIRLLRSFLLCACIFSVYIMVHSSVVRGNIYSEIKSDDINLIIGTTRTTLGTEREDVIIGCSSLVAECSIGDFIYAKEGSDVVQGSSADDNLYGDEGKDEVTGADGDDKLYGGLDNDVLQAGVGSDFLVGGPGDEELYGGAGDDVLIGGRGADYFDCGDGQDTIIDFNPAKGDTQAGNCEVASNHHANNVGSHVEENIQGSGVGDVSNSNSNSQQNAVPNTYSMEPDVSNNNGGSQQNAAPETNGIEMEPLAINRQQ
jgi:Ca2+-binding RTX toxin-like protein